MSYLRHAGGGRVGQAWDYTETGGPARLPAQVTGWRGHINWNSVRWGKRYFYWGVQSSQKSLIPARQAQRTNQERTPFVCTIWVPIHTSFNSQQGPPLSGLFRFEFMWQWVKGELNRCIGKTSIVIVLPLIVYVNSLVDITLQYTELKFDQPLSQMRCDNLQTVMIGPSWLPTSPYTVRKMDLILRSMERIPKIQFSMPCKFIFQPLHRYNIKHTKMLNFTHDAPWVSKLKNTGGAQTNILWIYSPRLYHCATITYEILTIVGSLSGIFSPNRDDF